MDEKPEEDKGTIQLQNPQGAVKFDMVDFGCDQIHVVERFLVDNKSLTRFKELVNKDLDHHLINGWNFVNKNMDDKNGSDPIEDTVFFYPIIGSIRDNLIENLM